MNIVTKKKNVYHFNKIIDSILYILGYTLVFFLVDTLFNSLYIENYLYGLLAVILIYILNKTVKPIIVKITIPITAITFGLFYPLVNFIILKLVDIVLLDHFQIYGIINGILIAFIISLMNFFVEELIIKPIIRKCDEK